MELHEAAYKYIDFIVSTAKFDTPEGTIRRVTEISEILKDWTEEPEYIQLFTDNRKEDILESTNLFKGPKKWINKVNSYDLTDLDVAKASKKLDFLSPKSGGSSRIPALCGRLAMDQDEFMLKLLSEAKMKSEMLMLAKEKDNESYLELPFVTESYGKYFTEAEKHAPDFETALKNWRNWLEESG